ncbi:hypothetical protein MRB53_003214 [Persea americana]|uniref:Uncharacterized protein n=1 Tax=Persea americana TaxID=3435 RepID=A0ACC2MWX9_PERAE|nr:hypothetical protein MRB53_003214 [Persea americana]
MGRAPCCSKVGLHKGPWTTKEDALLTKYIQAHGEGQWRSLPKKAGLLRCGKSCRLRWMNYLRPDIKRGNIGPDEEDLIIRLHSLLGNRWSLIAGRLPGRTDNEIKNYWNTHLSKRLKTRGADQNARNGLLKGVDLQKKKKKNNKKKNQKESKCKDEVVRGETKVHLPKPIRLTSFTRNFPVMETCDGNGNNNFGSGPSGRGGELVKEDLGVSWHDCKGDGLLDDEVDHVLDFPSQSQAPAKEGMLEKLYGEYLELLKEAEEKVQLDSYDESLWT